MILLIVAAFFAGVAAGIYLCEDSGEPTEDHDQRWRSSL
jgi:hypothetical protein